MSSPHSDIHRNDEDIHQRIEDLRAASKTPSRQRSTQLSSIVDPICSYAYEKGLDSKAVKLLVRLVTTSNYLDQANTNTIIRNLYPAEKIASDVIIDVVGCLGEGPSKPNFPVQASLLRWLVLVYDELEDPSILSSFYSILFNLLDMISLRTPLCHLLSLITRRKHVRPFRIQTLLEISRVTVDDPALRGLLRVFKTYYPELIVGSTISGRTTLFTVIDLEWKQRLQEIKKANAKEIEEGFPNNVSKFVMRGAKRSKISVLPEIRTSYVSESSVTLEEIQNMKELVWKIEKIELPNQVVSSIDNPIARTYLLVNPSEVAERRRDLWLASLLDDALDSLDSGAGKNELLQLLQTLLMFSERTKSLPAVVESFIERFVYRGFDREFVHLVLELTAYASIRDFKIFQEQVLEELEKHVLRISPSGAEALMTFYTRLLDNWSSDVIVYESDSSASDWLKALIDHASLLSLTLVQDKATPTSITIALAFYSSLARLVEHYPDNDNIPLPIPISQIIYLLFFTPQISSLSSVLGLLAEYKSTLEISQSRGGGPSRGDLSWFNGFIMDICNCIWRNRAFNTSDANAMGCLLSQNLLPSLERYVEKQGYDISSLFSFSFHPALCGVSISPLRAIEDKKEEEVEEIRKHAGPVTAKSLSTLGKTGGVKMTIPEYKIAVLRWFNEMGVKGIPDFMGSCIKGLQLSD